MNDLFAPVSRDERQEECKKAWLRAKGKGSIEACTGFGKTRVGLNCIEAVRSKYPNIKVLVIVPTEPLQKQWITNLDERGLGLNSDVQIVNSAIKQKQQCDFLILDETHRYGSDQFSQVFTQIKYNLILGLTATYERLDGKHVLMDKYCPIVDRIPIEVAKVSGWVADYVEFQVIITPKDLDIYQSYNREFTEHFEYFGFNWPLVNSMLGKDGYINRAKYRDEICTDESKRKEIFRDITYHATAFMRALQNRKKFIYNHPQKLEVVREILKYRMDKKVITFSANVKMAEAIGIGGVYTGKTSKKRNASILDDFRIASSGVLNSCAKLNEGADIPGVAVAIILGVDSSKTKATQRTGRAIRKEGNKYSEVFTLVLENTVECEWYRKSHEGINYVTIDVENLYKMLRGEPWEPYKKKVQNFTYRF